MIGTTFTHYRIIEKIGEGGMGVVYKAQDPRLGRLVAIKVLSPHRVADADRKARFVREARAASALNHPHIVTIHDIGSADGIDFIAMEFVDGSTLDRQIGPSGLSTARAIDIAVQVAEALDKAHRAGIVHRDLKPSNIMVSADGLVKVVDFGLAKLLEPPVAATDTTTLAMGAAAHSTEGFIVGTASYMSPEQAEGRPVDVRSDIFSFGAVLYEMITGRRAFANASAISTLAAVIHEDPPRPAGDARLVDIALRCLRKAPGDRYASGTELRDALRDLQQQAFSGQVIARPSWRTSRSLQVTVGLAALMVVAVVWISRNRDEVPRNAVLYTPQSLTGYEGHEFRPGISPDGSQVAFAWQGVKDDIGIYVKTINIEPPRTVFAGSGNYPVWSPDADRIAFVRFTGTGDTRLTDLCVISAQGGQEQMVAAGISWRGLSWSPDGKWLAFQRHTRQNAMALFRVDVATGTVQQLTHPDPGVEDEFPAYSSDGRHVAFSRRAGTDKALFLVPVEGGREAALGTVNGSAELAWIPGTTDLIINMKPGGSSDRGDVNHPAQLIRMSTVPPYRTEPMAGIGGGEIDFAIAGISMSRMPPGRLVYEIYPYDTNIWLARLNASTPGPAARIVASTRQDQGARFSRDGTRIVFRTNRSGRSELWLGMADGSGQMPLTGADTADGSLSFGEWSTDGRQIFFSVRNGLYGIPASGGTPRRLDDDPGHKDHPAWSPDGAFVYFRSNRSGSPQIWRMPTGGGVPVQITRDGGDYFSLAPDGKRLYFNRSELVEGVWSAPSEGGEEKLVAPGVRYRTWTVGRKGIYLIRRSVRSEFPGIIVLRDLDTGKETPVAYLTQLNLSNSLELSLSADEARMLLTVEDTRGADLMMVEGVR